MTGENCRQFSLLTWKTFIGQSVHQEVGEGMGWKGGIVILARCNFHFIREHENVV